MTTWLDLINAIPGLAKAVTELIGNISHIGSAASKLATARIGQQQAKIEDQTNRDTAVSQAITGAEVAITKALTDSAVDYIKSQGTVIGERALAHGIHRMIKQQANLEVVVVKTIDQLQIAPPDKVPAGLPSDDWLNLFGRYAENASSEKMREHWAHILAGEIKNPGSFSFIALHLASVLDEKLATTIEKFRPWIYLGSIPLIEPLAEGPYYSDVVTLDGIGFVSLGAHQVTVEPEKPEVNAIFKFDSGTITIPPISPFSVGEVTFHEHHRASFAAALITPAGKELLRALPSVPQTTELPARMMTYLEKNGFLGMSFEPKAT
jgi:hypothetical protein